jgi:hypothetical protein
VPAPLLLVVLKLLLLLLLRRPCLCCCCCCPAQFRLQSHHKTVKGCIDRGVTRNWSAAWCHFVVQHVSSPYLSERATTATCSSNKAVPW